MNYLIHHGIKGQHWGIQNGPPYPLDAKTHRKVIDKAKETTRKVKERVSNYRNSFDKQKAIKIGAIAAGTALAAVGGYYLYKSGALDSFVKSGKQIVGNFDKNGLLGSEISNGKFTKEIPNIESNSNNKLVSRFKRTTADISKAGASLSEIYDDKEYLDTINESGGHNNCPSTSLCHIFHRLYGADFKAIPDSEITPEKGELSYLKSFFKEDTINEIDPTYRLGSGANGCIFDKKLINLIPNGSTGVLALNYTNGHWVNYEKTKDGKFTMICNQNRRIATDETIDRLISNIPVPYKYCWKIIDLSHAELSEEGLKKLHEIVR